MDCPETSQHAAFDRGMSIHTIGTATLAVLATLLAGCLSYDARPLPIADPSTLAKHTTDGGISAGGRLFGPDDSKQFLGEDVTPHHLPLFIVIRNESDQDVMLQRADLTLNDGDGRTIHPVDFTVVAQATRKSGNDTGTGLLSGESADEEANDYNAALSADWKRKSFPEQFLLKRGRRVGGLLFYSSATLAKDALGFPVYRTVIKPPYLFDIEATSLKTDTTVTVELQFASSDQK